MRNGYLHIDRIIEFNSFRNQSSKYSAKFIKALFREFNLLKKFHSWEQTQAKRVFIDWFGMISTFIYYIMTEVLIETQAGHHQKENITGQLL